ncbi:hypothetical protein R3W88_000711 [Solanum pinnatisectum]|uniref:Uncharacterized protein n=1 Tax=Solanum pinnatisectum TaxID=50273 RepID=A0AAV9MJ23_9SOLN|nr:hypothetical protein R3W88_000711 [Solanum pinnatisectum]
MFHLWLAVQQRLSIVVRLQKYGIQFSGVGSIAPLVAPSSKYWTMAPKAGVDLSQGKAEK